MFETIVVATDGSEGALEAVDTAGELARSLGVSALHVVTACNPYSPAEVARLQNGLPDEFHDLINPDLEALNRFAQARTILDKHGVDAIDHEAPAGAAAGILDVAEEVDADLIVVGARGLGAIGRFLRGSVSTKIAHHAPCSVLIVEHGH